MANRRYHYFVLSPDGKVIVNILFGGNGDPVPHGWQEMPILQCCQHFVVYGWVIALQYNFGDNASPVINGDFNHDVSFGYIVQIIRTYPGFRTRNPYCWADFRPIRLTIR